MLFLCQKKQMTFSKLQPCLRVATVFSTKTITISESAVCTYSPKQPTSHQHHINQVLSHQSIQKIIFLHHKIPPCLRVAIVFSTTNYHHIRECSMYSPPQKYHQVLSHQSVQTIISEIAYTVSNSSPLGKEIMCRTLLWKENVHVTNHYDCFDNWYEIPANSSLSMLEFIIAFISQWTCYIMC